MSLNKDQLSRIKIKGYRSIRECDVALGKTNVLIGSNGAGKSNFVSAFALVQNVLAKNLQIGSAQSGIHAMFYNGMKETEEISVEVFFGQNSYGFELIPTDDNRLIFKREHYAYHGAGESESVIAQGNQESKWDAGVHNKIDQDVIPILERQNWRVYHFQDTSRNARIKWDQAVSNDRALLFDASNLAAFLYRLRRYYSNSYQEIVQTIRLVAPYFADFVLEPQDGDGERILLRWQQKGCEDVFGASQLSDGTLRFICLATLLLQPAEFQPSTIIIDEPELGLHPYAITLFAEMVRQLPQEKQIILSTQSVELLNEFDVEDIIVVDRREQGEGSVFRRLDSDELQEWLDEDYAVGELWKKNIIGGRP